MIRISGYVNTTEEFFEAIRTNCLSFGYVTKYYSFSQKETIIENKKGKSIHLKMNSFRNIEMDCFPSYYNGVARDQQISSLNRGLNSTELQKKPTIYFKDANVYYDLSITDDRIACIYNIEGTWLSFYVGSFKPYSNLVDYPNPLFIGGNCAPEEDISPHLLSSNNIVLGLDTSETLGYFQACLNQNNEWIMMSNQRENYNSIEYKLAIQPFYKNNPFENLSPDLNENQTIFPVIIQDVENGFYLGEFDGIYSTSSKYSNNNNSTITFNSEVYKIVNVTSNILGTENGMLAIRME